MTRKSMVGPALLATAILTLEAHSAKLAEPVIREYCMKGTASCNSQSPVSGVHETCSLAGMQHATPAEQETWCNFHAGDCSICWGGVMQADICVWIWTDESVGSDYHCTTYGAPFNCGKIKTGGCFWSDLGVCSCPSNGPDMGNCTFDMCVP